MDMDRTFRILYGGTWEEGPPHIFPLDESGVEDLTVDGANKEFDEDQETVEFLGKKFDIDQLDASDEEFCISESESEDEGESEIDAHVLPLKKSASRGSNLDGEDGDFIRRTEELEEDEETDNVDGKRLKLFKDQTWVDIYVCREHLRDYAIQNKFVIKFKKNDSDKIIGECKHYPECLWRVYVARLNDKHTMECRGLNEPHTCEGDVNDRNEMAIAPWIAKKIEKYMRIHHKTCKPCSVISHMRHEHKINITYWQAWNARLLALEMLNYEESYGKIPELCRQIHLSNPGSLCVYGRDHLTGTFTHLGLSFKASIDGFLTGCRPLIGLDGCFLKGKYGGACLSMIALDGNNGMFPLALYICLSEDRDNWEKFLRFMEPHISKHRKALTFMSDRQKGLIQAVASVFPSSYQRFCFRHMVKNLRTRYRGVDHIVWAAARAYRESDFGRHMEELKKVDKKARDYMDTKPPSLWTRSSFCKTAKSDHNTNNFTECFNSYILEARDRPIVHLIVKIQSLFMKLIFHRKQLCLGWDPNGLVPRVQKEIAKMVEKRFDYNVSASNAYEFEVVHIYGQSFTVNAHVASGN